ncbi:MAG: CRTAC1 family protein [Polyangiaceae bacterium]|jgi:hypothetical protein|nr:CRTAC1 family protein [Polyangiaceae bacterium]
MKKVAAWGMSRILRWMAVSAVVAAPATAAATPPSSSTAVTFTNIASGGGAGIGYRRTRSPSDALFDAIKLKPFYALPEITATPLKSRGAPGVAVLDYDGDGDLDLYVTNGPGTPNSLYQSQLRQGGGMTFVDVAGTAGVGATTQDSTGTCYGDIDNDGDPDLLVLGMMESNRLFRNNGNGTFTDITGAAGLGGGALGHVSCAMGDVNGDGLLDIVVANAFDLSRQDAIFTDLFAFNQPNQLFLNQGNNSFTDVSDTSGIRALFEVPQGNATITWAVSLVDYDQDGDLDLIQADDQAAMPPGAFAGVDRGRIHILRNDGTGQFLDITEAAFPSPPGVFPPLKPPTAAWMGLSFGDLNDDGHMDMFSSSLGDYLAQQYGIPIPNGAYSSRWFFGAGGGAFSQIDIAKTAFRANPFGWGTSINDFDNDGDSDITYFGGMDVGPFIQVDNPGVMLLNDGAGNLTFDGAAFASSREQTQRSEVQGVGVGDLNDDGFPDVVHVASAYIPTSIPLVKTVPQWGGIFDATAVIAPTFIPTGPLEGEWAGKNLEDGYLSVLLNNKNNNRWAKVRLKGTKGLTALGKNNRDGIGAVVKFTPRNGKTVLYPVLGGSSYASQHALEQTFGLGNQSRGTLEIHWTGGVKNRLYDVLPNERLTVPEIPCDCEGSWPSKNAYRACVDTALGELVSNNTITSSYRNRLRQSAYKAYDDCH